DLVTVRVPAGAGYAPVNVTSDGLTASTAKPFVLTFPGAQPVAQGSFSEGLEFPCGANPRSVAMVDVNRDGRLDVVIANDGGASISVLQNLQTDSHLGPGSLGNRVDLAAGQRPIYVAAADLDGDGWVDLVVANWESSTIGVYRNMGRRGDIAASS